MADEVIRNVVINVSVKSKDADLGPLAQKINDLDKQREKSQKVIETSKKKEVDLTKAIQLGANQEAQARFKQIQLAERLAVIERKRTAELQKQVELRRKEFAESIKSGLGKIGTGGAIGGAIIGGMALGQSALEEATGMIHDIRHIITGQLEESKLFVAGKDFWAEVFGAARDVGGKEAPNQLLGAVAQAFPGGKQMLKMFGINADEIAPEKKKRQGVFVNGQKVDVQDERLKNLRTIDQYERDHISILKERNAAELELIRTEKKKISDFELQFGLMNREQQAQVKEIDKAIQAGGLSSLNKEQLDLARQLGLQQFKGNEQAIRQNAQQGGVYDLSFIKDAMKQVADAQAKIAQDVAKGIKEFNLNQTIDVIVHGMMDGDFKSSVKKEMEAIVEKKVQEEFRKAMQALNGPQF